MKANLKAPVRQRLSGAHAWLTMRAPAAPLVTARIHLPFLERLDAAPFEITDSEAAALGRFITAPDAPLSPIDHDLLLYLVQKYFGRLNY